MERKNTETIELQSFHNHPNDNPQTEPHFQCEMPTTATIAPSNKKIPSSKFKIHMQRFWLYHLLILIELIMLILYGLFTSYDIFNKTKLSKTTDKDTFILLYPLTMDVHVMIFVGFGFIMTFLKKYSWSAVGKNFLIAAWTIQLSILTIGFFRAVMLSDWSHPIVLDLRKVIDADLAAATILISFGAVLGKMHITQYMTMATIATIFYSLEMSMTFNLFYALDIGGSMTIHAFGAFFGLAVTMVMRREDVRHHPDNSSSYFSNLTSMIGTLFLWVFWPAFNVGLADVSVQQRCLINTLLSIAASCVIVFLLTPFFKDGKFHMEYALNATLAGGVIIAASADVIIYPWVAFLIGLVGGVSSTVGFEIISPYLTEKIDLQDTCGVLSLHGIPGILGGLISAFIVGFAAKENYGDSFEVLFPYIANGTRSSGAQAAYTILSLVVILVIAVASGVITGLILKSRMFHQIEYVFDDEEGWYVAAVKDDPEEDSQEDKEKLVVGDIKGANDDKHLGNVGNVQTDPNEIKDEHLEHDGLAQIGDVEGNALPIVTKVVTSINKDGNKKVKVFKYHVRKSSNLFRPLYIQR